MKTRSAERTKSFGTFILIETIMSYDLIPKNFFTFPASRFFDFDEDDVWVNNNASSGLSVSEDETHVYIQAALPGIEPEDIEMTFEKGMLWVKGEKKEEEEDKKKKFYRKSSSAFSYRVAVPGEIDLNQEPVAESKHGVMTITFAKHPKAQPKKISIKPKK